ncbi:uncharacterized protein LOC107429770 isoform X4 [Ziziphus jujuba]|uniref:Uncharacterized protein LOC107429770 isoform X4 n=1 Tax=Ziziphus jujuba TaxID=326968 RepID=A0ABM4ACA0_ZIZJJ|nr:uncharacterized protein LOC107429770 isoform X4 [Ziziphus jujuba]
MLFGKEKVIVPENKTNLILEGKGYLNTFLSWNETAGSRRGTFYRFSVNIPASNFIAYNLSFQRVRCRESSIEIPITEECYILLFSLCWCKECRNYTCSKHICGEVGQWTISVTTILFLLVNVGPSMFIIKDKDPWRIC